MRRITAPAIIAWLALELGLGGLGGLASPAAAHVAPATSDNNRYIKLTPLGDRVRLAYTVFYGEVPGAELRRTLDTDHDGLIDDAESQAFGDRIARELAGALDATVDGAAQRVTWSQVVVGLGTPRTAAGTFSIDLVASLCLPRARGAHVVELRDRFALARPGETQIRFEDSPGVTALRARVGDDTAPGIDYTIIGPTPVLAAPGDGGGIELRFTARDGAVVASDAACRAAAPDGGRTPAILGAAAAAAALALGAVMMARRAKRARQARRRS